MGIRLHRSAPTPTLPRYRVQEAADLNMLNSLPVSEEQIPRQTFCEVVSELVACVNFEHSKLAAIIVRPEPVILDKKVLRAVGQSLISG
jgi:hypothetical protein